MSRGAYEKRTADRWLAEPSENEVDDLLSCPVGDTEVDTGDGHEAHDNRCGLRDMATVGPLYSLKLGPAGTKKGDRTSVDRLGGLVGDNRALGSGAIAERFLGGLRAASTTTSPPACRDTFGRWRIERRLTILMLWLLLNWNSARAADERGVELVDVSGVRERSWKIRPNRPGLGWSRGALTCGPGHRIRRTWSALPCALAVTGHGSAPALASLPVAGVPTAPATVLAQAHPIGIVALGLVCLVVAVLALLAGEGDSDPNVSASHSYPCVVVDNCAGPMPGARAGKSSAAGRSAHRGSNEPAPAWPSRSGNRVLDCAETLDLDAHNIARAEEAGWIEAHADSARGARQDQVAWLQGAGLRDELD
jgi:hypothetical protein